MAVTTIGNLASIAAEGDFTLSDLRLFERWFIHLAETLPYLDPRRCKTPPMSRTDPLSFAGGEWQPSALEAVASGAVYYFDIAHGWIMALAGRKPVKLLSPRVVNPYVVEIDLEEIVRAFDRRDAQKSIQQAFSADTGDAKRIAGLLRCEAQACSVRRRDSTEAPYEKKYAPPKMPDGPGHGNTFWWKGTEHPCSPQVHKILSCVWQASNIAKKDFVSAVWGSRKLLANEKSAIDTAISRCNTFCVGRSLPFVLRLRGKDIVISRAEPLTKNLRQP
jgi:hypothetical protein